MQNNNFMACVLWVRLKDQSINLNMWICRNVCFQKISIPPPQKGFAVWPQPPVWIFQNQPLDMQGKWSFVPLAHKLQKRKKIKNIIFRKPVEKKNLVVNKTYVDTRLIIWKQRWLQRSRDPWLFIYDAFVNKLRNVHDLENNRLFDMSG